MTAPAAVAPLRPASPRTTPPHVNFAAMAARRPTLEESFEDFVEGVGRVPTQALKKALVSVYQVERASERSRDCVLVLDLISVLIWVWVLVMIWWDFSVGFWLYTVWVMIS